MKSIQEIERDILQACKSLYQAYSKLAGQEGDELKAGLTSVRVTQSSGGSTAQYIEQLQSHYNTTAQRMDNIRAITIRDCEKIYKKNSMEGHLHELRVVDEERFQRCLKSVEESIGQLLEICNELHSLAKDLRSHAEKVSEDADKEKVKAQHFADAMALYGEAGLDVISKLYSMEKEEEKLLI